MTADFVRAEDFMKALHQAGLLPQYPHCRRVVIDAEVGCLVQMFVDQIPNEALLSIAPLMSAAASEKANARTEALARAALAKNLRESATIMTQRCAAEYRHVAGLLEDDEISVEQAHARLRAADIGWPT